MRNQLYTCGFEQQLFYNCIEVMKCVEEARRFMRNRRSMHFTIENNHCNNCSGSCLFLAIFSF